MGTRKAGARNRKAAYDSSPPTCAQKHRFAHAHTHKHARPIMHNLVSLSQRKRRSFDNPVIRMKKREISSRAKIHRPASTTTSNNNNKDNNKNNNSDEKERMLMLILC